MTAATELKGGYQPQLPLELALIEAVRGEPAPVVQVVATDSAGGSSASSDSVIRQRQATRAGGETGAA